MGVLSTLLLLAGPPRPRKAGVAESAQNGPFLGSAQRCNWGRGGYSPREIEPPSPGRDCRPVCPEIDTREASMFTSPAFAQGLFGGGGGDSSSMIMSLLPFALIFVIMYFLILRPQQKKVKSHQEMVKNVRRGDTVVTNGGLIGKVTKVIDDDQIEIEIADEVRIRQMRQMVTDVRAKGEPVKDEAATG
jgi:preprotein translocase subunit YajC